MTVTIITGLITIFSVVAPFVINLLVNRNVEQEIKDAALVKANLSGVDAIADKLHDA